MGMALDVASRLSEWILLERKLGKYDVALQPENYLLPDLGPGLLVLLEGIDFHPAFEDWHGVNTMATVDEFLDHIGKGGFADTRCFVKPGRLVSFQ